MRPVLFSLGPFHLYSFGLLVAAGILLSLALMRREAVRSGFPKREDVYDLVFLVVATGFFGARLLYGIENIQAYAAAPVKILAIWEGGLVFYGGVIGSLLGVAWWAKRHHVTAARTLDFLLPYVALTHAFGRIGCFLNGCCYGKVCPFPWGIHFPGNSEPLHPTQLYETVFNVSLFFFLSRLSRRRHFEGEVTGFYFLFYAAGRFAIEFFRADNPSIFSLTWNQWGSVVLFICALGFLLRRRPRIS